MLSYRHAVRSDLRKEADNHKRGAIGEQMESGRTYERVAHRFYLDCKETKDPCNEMGERDGATFSEAWQASRHGGLQPVREGSDRWTRGCRDGS